MKHKLFLWMAFALLLSLSSSIASAQAVGDLVTLRIATSQYNLAIVGKVVSGTTLNLVAFTDGGTWQDTSDPPNFSTITYYNRTPGTSVGQYQTTTIIADTVSAAGFATSSSVTSAIAAAVAGLATSSYVDVAAADLESYVDTLGPTYLALPTAPSSAGLTLGGAGVQLSATRPVQLVVRGTATMASLLGSTVAFTVELRCDSGSTPTAVVDSDAGSFADTVAATSVVPWKLVTMAREDDYCRVVQSAGAATLALTGSSKQPL